MSYPAQQPPDPYTKAPYQPGPYSQPRQPPVNPGPPQQAAPSWTQPPPKKRGPLPWIIVIVAGIVGLSVLGGVMYTTKDDSQPASTAPAGDVASPHATPAKPTQSPADPYLVYLKIAPKGAVHLSREDAQTRALLGCGQDWAPGTVDAALAKAYASLCKKN